MVYYPIRITKGSKEEEMRRTKTPSTSVRYPSFPEDSTMVRRARFTDVGELVEESTYTRENAAETRRCRWAAAKAGKPGPALNLEVK
jgi:hypothetical protein